MLDRPVVSNPESARRALERELDTLRHHFAPDEVPGYRSRAEGLHTVAKRFGDATMVVHALLVLSRAPGDDDEHANGSTEARAAYDLAVRADDPALAARAAAVIASFEHPESEAYSHWVRTAEAHIEMAGGDLEAEVDLLHAQTVAAMELEHWDLALELWEPAVALYEEYLGHDHPATGNAYEMLASICQFLDRTEAAHRAITAAIEIYDGNAPADSPTVATARVELGRILFELGDHVGAAHAIELAIRRLHRADDPSGAAVHALAYGHWTLGMVLESLEQYRAALAHYAVVWHDFPPHAAYNSLLLHRGIAEAHLALGERAEAVAALERALTFMDPNGAEWEERVDTRKMLADLQRCTHVDPRQGRQGLTACAEATATP